MTTNTLIELYITCCISCFSELWTHSKNGRDRCI